MSPRDDEAIRQRQVIEEAETRAEEIIGQADDEAGRLRENAQRQMETAVSTLIGRIFAVSPEHQAGRMP